MRIPWPGPSIAMRVPSMNGQFWEYTSKRVEFSLLRTGCTFSQRSCPSLVLLLLQLKFIMHPQEQINSYIAEHPEWQRLLMIRLRQLIHSVDPDVEETWRWNGPHFDHDGIMVGIHGFKTCVSVWFHKGALLKDAQGLFKLTEKDEERGIRKYKLSEGEAIHEKAFSDLVKQAVRLNLTGVKLGDAKPPRKILELPSDLEGCLKKDETTWKHWENFSSTHKKEYVEWIIDAKKDETRKRRIAQALEMIREGIGKEEKHRVS